MTEQGIRNECYVYPWRIFPSTGMLRCELIWFLRVQGQNRVFNYPVQIERSDSIPAPELEVFKKEVIGKAYAQNIANLLAFFKQNNIALETIEQGDLSPKWKDVLIKYDILK